MKARVHECVIARCSIHLDRVGLSKVPMIRCAAAKACLWWMAAGMSGRHEGQPEVQRSVTNTHGTRTEVLSEV